jgi:hypothetical protein
LVYLSRNLEPESGIDISSKMKQKVSCSAFRVLSL